MNGVMCLLCTFQASFRTQEPILNLQRTVLNLARHEKNLALEKDIGLSWLHSAKVSRKWVKANNIMSINTLP